MRLTLIPERLSLPACRQAGEATRQSFLRFLTSFGMTRNLDSNGTM